MILIIKNGGGNMKAEAVELMRDEFAAMLQGCGYKMTSQRLRVLDTIIRNGDKHLKIEEIFDDVKSDNNDIGLATIYRTMQLFEEIGLVRNVNIGDGYLRYHVVDRTEKSEHCHFVCKVCGKVTDVHKNFMSFFEDDEFSELEFLLTGCKVQLVGICKNCLEKMNDEKK